MQIVPAGEGTRWRLSGLANPVTIYGLAMSGPQRHHVKDRMKRILLAVLAVLGMSGPGRLVAQAAEAIPTGEPTLRPGDMVRISVLNRPDLTGEFMVSADGTVRTPAYQSVVVADVPLQAAQRNLREHIATFQPDPQFVVEPLFRVAVGGGVTSPSLYALPPETTLAQAVATAGGAKASGRLNKVRLYRGGEEYVVDLTEAGAIATLPIRSGDQIIVSERRPVLENASTILSVVVSAINLYVLVENLGN